MGVESSLVDRVKPHSDITDPQIAKALAHPLRTQVLTALEDRVASPSELAGELGVQLGVISYHFRRLEALGLVKLVKRTPRRGAVEHYYKTTDRVPVAGMTWTAAPKVVKQATLAAAIDKVGQDVNGAAGGGGFDRAESRVARSPVTVDGEGFAELARECDAMLERIRAIESASKQRLAKSDDHGGQHATVAVMLFDSPGAASTTARRNGAKQPPARRSRARQ